MCCSDVTEKSLRTQNQSERFILVNVYAEVDDKIFSCSGIINHSMISLIRQPSDISNLNWQFLLKYEHCEDFICFVFFV